MSEPHAYLARAQALLGSAELLLEHGDTASSISRSYYAMFMAAEAALLTKGMAAASHRGVIATFGQEFVLTGLVPRETGRDLAIAHEQRVAAEYDPTSAIAASAAEDILGRARGFVATVAPLLG